MNNKQMAATDASQNPPGLRSSTLSRSFIENVQRAISGVLAVHREDFHTEKDLIESLIIYLSSRDAAIDDMHHWTFKEGKTLQVLEATKMDAVHLSRRLLHLKQNPPQKNDLEKAEFAWICVHMRL